MSYHEYDKWLVGPVPGSKIQEITAKRSTFDIKNLGEKVSNGQYPRKLLHPDHPKTVWFWEIRGRGRPPKDIQAHPGDIYIDMAASPIVNVFQKDVGGWNWWWNPSSTEMLKTFNMLPHPHIQDRVLTTTKGRGCGSSQIYLSYLCAATVKARGSIADRDLSWRGELAEMFPSNTVVNQGTIAVARPIATIQVDHCRPIVVPTSVKTRTIQNQTVSVSTLPANHSQARFSQGILLGRVTELEKTLREERISFKSTIDELKTTLARERRAREIISVKLDEAKTELKTVEALNDDLDAKYVMALHRLGDEQGRLVDVKRKLYEICSELQVDNHSEISRAYRQKIDHPS